MKTKELKISNVFFLSFLICLTGSFAFAQEYQNLEDLQDENMVYYTEIYRIVDDYPEFEYRYIYSDGEVEKVIVENVDDEMDRKKLEVLIYELKKNREAQKNIPTRTGVYYCVDEEAEPEEGFRTFYNNLYENLSYPEEAREWGAEGNVYVKFIVDSEGEIDFMKATEDIEASTDRYVKDLKEAAMEAVLATSGNWEPARVSGVPVASWAVIPVIFKIEPYPQLPMMVR